MSTTLLKGHEQYVTDENGVKIAVILPLEEYEELRGDIHDLTIIAERKEESTVSLEDVKKRLKQDGLL